jgi:hypothetical protein
LHANYLSTEVWLDERGTWRMISSQTLALAVALTGSVNGGKPFALQEELKDLLFVAGQPRVRRVVQRDASGHIVAILSRREGHDIVLKRL